MVQIVDTAEYFRTAAKVGGVIDLAEQYPWDGTHVKQKRRDKRRGYHTGRVVRSPGGISLE